ncbi:MFS transporter [Saccharicrinis sp. FJH54]|uniref:MFS transporter n=1 Tax=Saccharicrinis sp. FJH54 TaxID=3344665 RepID=UPI0035D4D66D
MRNIQNNIINLYLIKVSKWFMLTQPILMLYFKDTGLTTEQAFKLKAIYSAAIVLLELPSGYFADVLGRRLTLIIGAICGTLGFLFYSLGNDFWFFLIAELTLGIGQSFISGADSALMYDTLLVTGREKKFTLFDGRTTAIGNFAEAGSAILGGIIADISIRYPFFIQTGIAFIAVPAAFLLVEPKFEHQSDIKRGFMDIIRILKSSISHPMLRNSILFSSFTGLGTLTMAWIVQLYLDEGLHFSYGLIGTSTAILNLIVALFAALAYYLSRKVNNKTLQLGILFFIPTGFFLTGLLNNYITIGILVLFYLVRGVATPVLKNYINVHASSTDRATIFSIRSLVIRILFVLVGPLCGWLIDSYGYPTMFITIGFMLLFLNMAFVFPGLLRDR